MGRRRRLRAGYWEKSDRLLGKGSLAKNMRKSNNLTRRTLLRGVGAAMSVPWLESIAAGAPVRASEALAEPPLRSAFFFMPNGVRPDYWTPPGDGEDFEITPH